jgi:16S rRNA (guanine527-N7)-methyltransferase
MNNFKEILKQNTLFSDDVIDKLYEFNELLYEKNEVLNLTRVKKDESVYRNFLDSLNSIAVVELKGTKQVIDIGSGSGFPSIALAIAFSDTRFTLVEATGKKAQFLKEAANKLGLTNVEVLSVRAEELAHNNDYREKYDVATARAVARMSVLSELCCGFIKKGGKMLCYKGRDAKAELEDAKHSLKMLNLKVGTVKNYTIFDENDSMYMIVINKYDNISSKYPRNYSKIIKTLKNK